MQQPGLLIVLGRDWTIKDGSNAKQFAHTCASHWGIETKTHFSGQVYGEMSPKNADTLFLYGKALLEYAIQQSSVLGGVTEKKSEKELQAVVDAVTGGASGTVTPSLQSR